MGCPVLHVSIPIVLQYHLIVLSVFIPFSQYYDLSSTALLFYIPAMPKPVRSKRISRRKKRRNQKHLINPAHLQPPALLGTDNSAVTAAPPLPDEEIGHGIFKEDISD